MAARWLWAIGAVALGQVAYADGLDDVVRRHMRDEHLVGASVAVVRNGRLVAARGYGFANLELGVRARPETVYRIASMSKQFTSAAIMLLADEGKIDLDRSVRAYLPNAPEGWEPVTIRHILTHTSGIPNVTENKAFDFGREYDERELLDFLRPLPLDFAPGSGWHYTNTGYSVLGLVVGHVAGMPLEQFVQERVLGPLGMRDTRYFDDRQIVPNRAQGYEWRKDHHELALWQRPTSMAGSGAVMSTVLDFAKWDAALYTDRPLSERLKRQIWTPVRLTDGTPKEYGFGWYVRTFEGTPSLEHTGTTPGFTSAIVRLPEERLTVVVFRNTGGTGSIAMAKEIASLYRRRSSTKVKP